jgi:peptide/nickel transport system permease protein
MATLELNIDEDVAASPVTRNRGPGPLFWTAIVWMIVVFVVAALADWLPLPSPTGIGSAPTASGGTSWRG